MNPLARAARRLHEQLGGVALAALGLLGLGLLFLAFAVRPLEARLAQLEDELARGSRASAASIRHGTAAVQLAAFYGYFEHADSQAEWLAKLYMTARAAGLELRTADYRLAAAEGRIARYEIALPLTGSYAQLRTFLARALDQNPILSLDQLALRRKRVNDSVIEAEASLTLHLLRP